MDHCEPAFEGSIKGLFGRFLLRRSTSLYNSFRVLNVHITKVIIPILIGDGGCLGKLALSERCVNLSGGCIEFVQDPKLCERFLTGRSGQLLGNEGGVEFAENVSSGLVDLITELAVALHDLYIEVYITAW